MYVFTYCTWFMCGYKIYEEIQHQMIHRRAVLSLIAALFLAPVGIYEQMLFWTGKIPTMTSNAWHIEVVSFYLGYIIIDTWNGCTAYPEFFTLVDGWLHHLSTAAFAWISCYVGMSRVFALSMIVEVPTILLQLDRVIGDEWTRTLRRTFFASLFVITRILLLGLFVWKLQDYPDIPVSYLTFCRVFYTGFTMMNLHWLGLMMRKKKQQTTTIPSLPMEVDPLSHNED